jgi:hypothetical protein
MGVHANAKLGPAGRYKDLEDKQVVVDGWCSRQDARDEIDAARERFRDAGRSPQEDR